MTDPHDAMGRTEKNPERDKLFRDLPDPDVTLPVAGTAAPVPGSRRAAREASAAAPSHSAASGSGVAGEAAAEGGAGGTLEELFQEEADPPHVAREGRKRRRTGCLVAAIILLVVLGGVVAGGAYVWNVYGERISEVMGWGEPKDYEPGMATGETLVTISEGDTGAEVSEALHGAGVTKTSDVFYDLLVAEASTETFFPGVYQLSQKMTAADALEALRDPAHKLDNSALVREGLTVEATLDILAESLDITRDELTAAVADPAAYGVGAQSLEGWLFPALYEFEPDDTASDVIAAMVERTKTSLADANVPAGDEQRVLTIASIVQREARFEADFYKVSRVIQNRLDTDMMLQMDSTAQYGYGELHAGEASTSDEAQHNDNPWNTYVHTGLPATPIANPGDLAIDAAMNPDDGPWLYFVTVNLDTGETLFTETYEEHLVGVEQMQQWCQANPDSGC